YALEGKWGRPQSVRLVSKRSNLSPLDESNFTNEYFTPHYVNAFYDIDAQKKAQLVHEQKYASDGNTPSHLQELYRTLYLNTLHARGPAFDILPMRECVDVQKTESGHKVFLHNQFLNEHEVINADVVILATGLEQRIPPFLEPILSRIKKDECQRLKIKKNFSLDWDGPQNNKIYALNFSRHEHGISEPQTSLMAWKSAIILNDLTNSNYYQVQNSIKPFVQYTKVED
ncbi:MAG: SidA/IucD/PvdA family monooxygenase, partial [Candidatus Caldatribacteriota bacterium]